MPVPDKVNVAFPLAPETALAEQRLRRWLADEPPSLPAFDASYAQRLQLRALNCSKEKAISRFASVASVKSMRLDLRCFQERDRELAEYVGMLAVGLKLGQPPLRPRKALGKSAVLPTGELPPYVNNGVLAVSANVAVLQSQTMELSAVEVPSGKLIAALGRSQHFYPDAALSPNGRVLAVRQDHSNLVFVDTETGTKLWETESLRRFHQWMPGVSAVLASDKDGALTIADLAVGAVRKHPSGMRNPSSATIVDPSSSTVLVVADAGLHLMDHVRAADGLQASIKREYRLANMAISSGPPVLMRDNKLAVFASHPSIGWLDLESGESGKYEVQPFVSGPFAKLDETHLLVDSAGSPSWQRKAWSFDIANQTLAPVEEKTGASGILIGFPGRAGFFRRANQIWVADEVDTGSPVSLESAVAEYNLQLQNARLLAQTRSLEASHAGSNGWPAVAATAAAEAARAAAAAAAAAVAAGAAPVSVPGLSQVPQDAVVHVVGVYQGSRATGTTVDRHAAREVRIDVRPGNKPIVLVLAAYDPVEWRLSVSGARVSTILLSGYHPSTVVGAGSVPVLRIGSEYAYQPGSAEYHRLRQRVSQYTGNREIRSFQGSYTGASFSVGP